MNFASLKPRDRRALVWLIVALVIVLVVQFWPSGGSATPVVQLDPVAFAESRLAKLRDQAATVPANRVDLQRATADLALRESGLIQAESAPQAQAQLMQILRRVAKNSTPPLDIRPLEMGTVRPLGDNYGEVTVSVAIECQIEQLVNLLADLTAQPEIVATDEMHITASDPKQKTLLVRLSVSGVVPRRLVPVKKGGAEF